MQFSCIQHHMMMDNVCSVSQQLQAGAPRVCVCPPVLCAGGIAFLNAVPLKVLKPLWLLQIFQATTLMKVGHGASCKGTWDS
jgi:hypothetical protein